jgi:hypothetical protein
MPDTQILREYLVNLGFQVSTPELRKFEDALRITGQQAEKFTTGIARSFTAAGASVIGVLTGISTGVLALADSVSRQDLEMQLFARRMFLSADAARQMKIAADALGFSLEDIVWGPKELQERYAGLVAEQKKLDEGMGGTAYIEDRLKRIRDLRNEFTKIQVAVTEGSRGLAASLYDKIFGGTQGEERLAKFNHFVDSLINDTPHIVDELSTALAPALFNTWKILSDIADITKTIFSWGLRIIGEIFNDEQLKSGQVNIENVGLALDHVSFALERLLNKLDRMAHFIESHKWAARLFGEGAGAAIGAKIGAGIGTAFGPEGTLPGAAIGAVIGGAFGSAAGSAIAAPSDSSSTPAQQSIADQARAAAAKISADTGIPADLLYGQFAFETSNFKHLAGANNIAGIKNRGGYGFQNFSSFDEFAERYENLIGMPRYWAAEGARTPEEFVRGLQQGGYFGTDDPNNYLSGVKRYAPEYHPTSGNASIDVGGITVNVTHPNATPEQIHQAVTSAVQESMDKQVARNIIQLSGSYA